MCDRLKTWCLVLAALLALNGCGGGGGGEAGDGGGGAGDGDSSSPLVVNTVVDRVSPLAGETTLRSAIAVAEPGDTITFAPDLNGQTIQLDIVGEEHSLLKGEVFTFTGSGFVFEGFQERDYGRSALYARKSLHIDASALPDGVVINWNDSTTRARILAVYGNLTMNNVTMTSGYAEFAATGDTLQPYTLGRGGGLAVWGIATLENCTFSGNTASGDLEGSRDRGAFGGAIYANRLIMENCIVAGNAATGFGAAGGGIYSVGGADGLGVGSNLRNCSISGNRVTGQHAYGGGVYSDGGGPGKRFDLDIENCTIARNLVTDHPGLDQSPMFQFYYRGGGVYMSNGHLSIASSTIVENQVTGNPFTFSDKLGLDRPNMGGGGVAATIGDAHVVEDITIRHSIIAGNRINALDAMDSSRIAASTADDLFSGSLLHFFSGGYNLIGTINFDFMLAPVPVWNSLSRKHWPKTGDQHDIQLGDVLSLGEVKQHDSMTSVGTDDGQKAVLWYSPLPGSAADDVVPVSDYDVTYTLVEDQDFSYGLTNGFLNDILDKLEGSYGTDWASDLVATMGDSGEISFFGPSVSWPSNPDNTDWVSFWRDLDAYLASKGEPLGSQRLGDEFWNSFPTGSMGGDVFLVVTNPQLGSFRAADVDQLYTLRPVGARGDIGAIEMD